MIKNTETKIENVCENLRNANKKCNHIAVIAHNSYGQCPSCSHKEQ